MKKASIFTTVLFLLCLGSIQAKNLWAFLTYTTFNSPEGPYIETYLAVDAATVKFVPTGSGRFQATVNVLMTFKTGNEIKAFRKYELTSNEIADTTLVNFHFHDQQRIALPNGTYDFDIQLADKNKSLAATPYTQSVSVDFPSDKPSFSGIQLVKSFSKSESNSNLTKSGYDLIPFTYTFFPETESKLTFYCELYNIDKLIPPDQKFILSYYIESFESNLKLGDFARIKKESSKPVNVLLSEMAIDNLASGNYNLVVEARDQKNELIASQKLFFQRINPQARLALGSIQATEISNTFVEKFTQSDTIREYINSTYPIATGLEKSFIRNNLKTADLKTMQQFLYTFWNQRNPVNPQQLFEAYRQQVEVAQANFGTPIKRGYQTDRGRVFLEYGPPNTRSTQYNEPSNYPYEIWQYYTLKNNQRNRKFVFYSADMVTSDFELLHSDATGEQNNPRWRIDLRNRIYSTLDIQETQVINSWGDMQEDYWQLPN